MKSTPQYYLYNTQKMLRATFSAAVGCFPFSSTCRSFHYYQLLFSHQSASALIVYFSVPLIDILYILYYNTLGGEGAEGVGKIENGKNAGQKNEK